MGENKTEEKLMLALGPLPEAFKNLESAGFRIQELEEVDELASAIGNNERALIVVEEGPQKRNFREVLDTLKEANHTNPLMVLVEGDAGEDYSDADYEGVIHAYDRNKEPAILVQAALRAIVRNAVMTDED